MDQINNTGIEETYEKHSGGNVRVWQVTNNMKGPENGKKYYMLSPYEDEGGIVARVRDKVKSKTARGGAKALSKTMGKIGDDYQDKFTLKPVSGWINRSRAIELRNKLSKNAKAKSGKVYNDVNREPGYQD